MRYPPTDDRATCWQGAALVAALAVLARIIWDEARRVGTIPPEHEWEPDLILYSIDDLRETLYQVVHAAWIEGTAWDDDGPVEDLRADEILREALAPYEDVLERMGWLQRRSC